jgi:hypothetical protein
MNWDAIGALAEVLGALAVFVTLVYLAYQLRQNNILLKEQAKYHMLQNQISYHDRFVVNPELVKTMYGQHLSEAENLRLRRLSGAVAVFFRWNWEYLRAQERIFGLTDVPTDAFAYEFSKANLGEFWDDVKHIYDPEFVTFMDRKVIPQVS